MWWGRFGALVASVAATTLPGLAAAAYTHADLSFDAPASAVLVGQDIARSHWPTRLAAPSAEGQFEVAVRKDVVPVAAPHCRNRYLIVRMPATMGEDAQAQAELARKQAAFQDIATKYASGLPIHFNVFAGPYGSRGRDGRITLSGCNLFFVEPAPG